MTSNEKKLQNSEESIFTINNSNQNSKLLK